METRIKDARAWRTAGVGLTAALLAALVAGSSLAASSGAPVEGVVNVNTATVTQLEALPGVGEVRARAIVRLRKQRGGIQNLDELTQVRGVGTALLQKLRRHLTLDGKTTIGRP